MSSKEESQAALKATSTSMRPSSPKSQESSTSAHRILPLSAEAISQIHSSKHITSLQTVVLALLENSLDARSTEVDISVDWRRGGCSVNDDGVGIPRAEFGETGGLGRMYCTSKRAPIGTMSDNPAKVFHGSNGTFLAELAAMSLLSITSMQIGDHDSSTLAFHQGEVITRHMAPFDPKLPSTCRLHGTNVSVRDLFGNMPVRVKQRALAGESSREKGWHELKRGIVALLLAWPAPCAVKLRDASGQHKAVNIVGYHPKVTSALTEKSLNRLAGKKAKFDLRDNMPILFHVGLAPPESASRWIPLSASTSAFTLKGMICLDPAPTRQCQFLALGISPCGNGNSNSELHEAVNKVFANSSFGIVEERPGSVSVSQDKDRAVDYTAKDLQAQKGVDRYPMYCLQMAFRTTAQHGSSTVDNINDATLKGLVSILEASVTAWLDSHGFRPRKRRRKRNEEQQSPAVASTSSARPSDAPDTQSPRSPAQLLRTASAPGHPSEQAQYQDASRPTSKRRKIVDMSTEDKAGFGRSRTLQKHGADPTLQSHIRAGRTVSRTQTAHGPAFSVTKKPLGAEIGKLRPRTTDSEDLHQANPAAFGPAGRSPDSHDLPDADRRTPATKARASVSTLPQDNQSGIIARTESKALSSSKYVPTSDDFGALDDADMLQAEDNAPLDAAPATVLTSIERAGEDDIVAWRDPVSKQLHRVNSRTGVVLPAAITPQDITSDSGTGQATRNRAGIDTALSSTGKPLSLARRAAIAAKNDPPEVSATKDNWLPGFLQDWNSPVFAAMKEEPIPVASIDGPGLLENEGQAKCCARGAAGLHTSAQASVHAAGTKLSKVPFKHAQVIAQVDQKFILCRMPASAPTIDTIANTSSLLVLIDQHAASERIILEDLLSSLFTVTSSGLSVRTANLLTGTSKSQDLRYAITQQEHSLFNQYKSHFSLFGMHYTSLPTKPLSHNNTGFHATRSAKQEYRLTVTDLPTVIAERCAKLPTICIDLLRSELWSLHDKNRNPISRLPAPDEDPPYWVKVLPLLPPKLLTMLQSRSCRSAIMFNDPLSMDQCRKLVKDLGNRVFPFGCAHGRVSMVPLVDLGTEEGEVGDGVGAIEKDMRWTRKPKELEKEGEVLVDWRQRGEVCDVGRLGVWMQTKGKKMKE